MTDPLDLPALKAIAQAATQGDIAGRLRAFLKPHVHISAAHKDALADAASYFEAIQPDIATLITRAEKAEAALGEARVSAFEEIALWLEPQRHDVPAHGWEFANALRATAKEGTEG